MLIVMAAQEMGWDIAISDKDPEADLDGMTIGTPAYINNTLGIEKQGCQCGGNCNDSKECCGDTCTDTCCKSE
jgi:hypothetical protein